MELRKYQSEASGAVFASLRKGNNPCVLLPTGTGKSLVVADLCDRLRSNKGRVWVLTHVKELVVQNRRTLKNYSSLKDVGTICAGLNENKEGASITFATIQSIYRPAIAKVLQPPHAIIIDEAHRIPPGKDGKWYNEVLRAYPEARRIGMTATPWRMDNGLIYGDGEDLWFNDLAYEKTVAEMVELKYLAPLIGVHTEVQLDLSGVAKNAGDFVQKQVGDKQTDKWLEAVVKSVQSLGGKRKHIAIYCPTVEAANNTAKAFEAAGWMSGVVVGSTDNRHEVIDAWKAGVLRVLCSVDVLTTGFDFPALDCLVCLRPTESSSLWVQILGRGTRIHDGKTNCLILDYVGNLARLGGIGMMEDYSVEKGGKVAETRKAKPGEKKPRKEKKPGNLAALDPMMGNSKELRVSVTDVSYVLIPSRTQEGKHILMVSYEAETSDGYPLTASLFCCPEYSGYARAEAERFFARRGGDCPHTANQARYACYGLPTPREITVKRNGKYINVLREHF